MPEYPYVTVSAEEVNSSVEEKEEDGSRICHWLALWSQDWCSIKTAVLGVPSATWQGRKWILAFVPFSLCWLTSSSAEVILSKLHALRVP